MAVRILGLRTYTDKKSGKLKKAERFKEQEWQGESVADVILNFEDYIEKIPEKERYNLFLTFAHSLNNNRKKFEKQNVIVFDIDEIDSHRMDEYYEPISEALQVPFTEAAWIHTGNGFHIIIGLDYTIETTDFYDENRIYYKAICSLIDRRLKELKLPGKADPDYFKYTNMVRMPGTINNKTPSTGYPRKNSVKNVTLLQRIITPQQEYYLHEKAGIEFVEDKEHISESQLARYPKPDTDTVLSECEFLQHCTNSPEEIGEDAWYKMLSIVPRLKDGVEIAHKISEGHSGYDPDETNEKISKALVSSGPRTCKNIEQSFPGCLNCKHYNKITSPILIKGPDYISTETTGFRKVSSDANGNPKPGKPEYEDLLKFFTKKHKFVCTPNKITYTWEGSYWVPQADTYIDEFMEKTVIPKPSSNECNEFRAKVYRNNIVKENFFDSSIFKKINLKNGILELIGDSPKLVPHSPKVGFLSVLPYEYDPNATCPRWDKFMKEITLDRPELIRILMQFAGYSFANMDCVLAKALILLGSGSNGKSTFMEILQDLAGENSYASIPLSRLHNDQYAAMLQGKLFNMTEETPSEAFKDSSVFKNLVAGGTYMAKIVYKQPIILRNRSKFITACNEMPRSKDVTHGMLRRLLIVPFNAKFSKSGVIDTGIKDKLRKELPGILNRVIEGYYDLRDLGDFSNAKAVEEETKEFVLENDPIDEFISQYITINDECLSWVPLQDVYDVFKDYCDDVGILQYDRPQLIPFSKVVHNKIPTMRKKRKNIGGKKVTVLQGINPINAGTNHEF